MAQTQSAGPGTTAHIAVLAGKDDLPKPASADVTGAEQPEVAHARDHDHATSRAMRLANLLVIVTPFLGLIAAVVMLWGAPWYWLYAGLFFAMYMVTGFGITVGFHRYFTHKSFDANPVMKFILGVSGSMAVQGPILFWVATHRGHHQHSDGEEDPHSPHAYGGGFVGILKGAFHAQCGWLLKGKTRADIKRYAPDLQRDKMVVWMSKMFPVWVLLGIVGPGVIAYFVTGTWVGGVLGMLWGGLARVCFVHHVTWSVNSICHLWGTRAFESHDESRNNAIVGVLGLGEGWHNNHHAFPASARHGLRWWEFDASYVLIRGMKALGLVKAIRVPSTERIEAKRRKPAA